MTNKINYNQIKEGGVFDKCNIDVDRKSSTYIYYIPMEDCQDNIGKEGDNGNYIFEKKNYNSTSFYNDFKKMLEKCDSSNIMIFFSSYKKEQCGNSEEYVDNINKTIEKIAREFSSIRMLNVVIIHLTNNIDKVLFKININNKRYFKKVVNVMPHTVNRDGIVVHTTADIPGKNYPTDILNEIYEKAREIRTAGASVTLSYDLYSTLDSTKFPIPKDTLVKKEIVIKTIDVKTIDIKDTETKTTKFNDTWWFKYYMESPYCLYYRLFQSSGTCWMNATVNLFILLSPLSSILMEKFKAHPKKSVIEKYTYSDIKIDDYDFTTCIYIIVNQLLIQKNKPIQTDGDIIINMAKKLQHESVSKEHQEQFNGEGGSASQAILFIINKLDLYDSVNCVDLNFKFDFKSTTINSIPSLMDYCENMKSKIKLYTYVKEKEKVFSFSNLFIDSEKEDIQKIKDEDNFFTETIKNIFGEIKELRKKRKKLGDILKLSSVYDAVDDLNDHTKYTLNVLTTKYVEEYNTVNANLVEYYNGLDGSTQQRINKEYNEFMELNESIYKNKSKIYNILNNFKSFIHENFHLSLDNKKNNNVEKNTIINKLKKKPDSNSDPTDEEINLFMKKISEVKNIEARENQIEKDIIGQQIAQLDQENNNLDENSEKYKKNADIRNTLVNKYNDDLDPTILKEHEKKYLSELEKVIEKQLVATIQTTLSKDEISGIKELLKEIEANKKKTPVLSNDKMGYYLSETMKKVGGNKKILFVVGGLKSPNIRINGYILIGSLLSTDSHSIMGLKCLTDNKFYIYDSNNIIAQSQWNFGDYSGYYEKRDSGFGSGKYSEKVGDINEIECLVYVKE